MSAYITERDVREDMRDRTAADHMLLPDVAFSSEDIANAMRKAARRYNSIRPYVGYADPGQLPARSNLFFDGIAWALLEGLRVNASLNDMDYSAGNVQANVQGKLLENVGKLIEVYEKRFVEDATNNKISINLNDAFGSLG